MKPSTEDGGASGAVSGASDPRQNIVRCGYVVYSA